MGGDGVDPDAAVVETAESGVSGTGPSDAVAGWEMSTGVASGTGPTGNVASCKTLDELLGS